MPANPLCASVIIVEGSRTVYRIAMGRVSAVPSITTAKRCVAMDGVRVRARSDVAGELPRARCAAVLTQLYAGVDPALLAQSVKVAQYVIADPIRDSTAIRATDEALANHDIHIDIFDDETTPFDVWHMAPDDYGVYQAVANASIMPRTPIGTGGLAAARSRITALKHKGKTSPGMLKPSAGALQDARRSSSTSPTGSLSPVPRRSSATSEPENPLELTKVIYSNGVRTARADAAYNAAILTIRLRTESRFRNWFASVVLHYNRTQGVEEEDLRRANPCDAGAEAGSYIVAKEALAALWSACKGSPGVGFSWVGTKGDFAEAIRMRWEIRRTYRPTTPDVVKLTNLIATLRNDWQSHVILVGHSQGTILGAQAIRALPALEGHPVNVANRCVAALALAPAVSRAGYGLDEHHVKGLLANGDIVAGVANVEGWERFDAPFSAMVAAAPLWQQPIWGVLIRAVMNSYFVNPGLDKVVREIGSLHRECLPSAVFITLSSTLAN